MDTKAVTKSWVDYPARGDTLIVSYMPDSQKLKPQCARRPTTCAPFWTGPGGTSFTGEFASVLVPIPVRERIVAQARDIPADDTKRFRPIHAAPPQGHQWPRWPTVGEGAGGKGTHSVWLIAWRKHRATIALPLALRWLQSKKLAASDLISASTAARSTRAAPVFAAAWRIRAFSRVM